MSTPAEKNLRKPSALVAFGEAVRRHRKAKGLSQEMFADLYPKLYASVAETREVLATGAMFRGARLEATDMLSTDAAAELARTSRVTINAWIKSGRAIGVAHLRRGFKLPRWQFEEPVFAAIRPVSDALGSRDGWTLLRFFESPQGALGGISPRQALEQGVSAKQIAALATAEAH